MLFIACFAFFAEFNFWEEFKGRFDFIAVDYLIYTYEVIQNIKESYPLPLLLSSMLALVFLVIFITWRIGAFRAVFSDKASLFKRGICVVFIFFLAFIYAFFIPNTAAEYSKNRYNNELSKAGIYSFFAAFRSNEIDYEHHYLSKPKDWIFKQARAQMDAPYIQWKIRDSFLQKTLADHPAQAEQRPNVVLIFMESMSANFMARYGNTQSLTPTLDSLSSHSLVFDRLFATGTRTVRGIEAVSLSLPPTPGRSIVKRTNNSSMYGIGKVFKDKGYVRKFLYGGDGYFDNMNQFFANNGFHIIDRGRNYMIGDNLSTLRDRISDQEVSFENAWGICDEDIYRRAIKEADKDARRGKPFFQFLMTTSNHRPYTYPEGKIDIPSGAGRDGAVKYSDYAIKKFLQSAHTKPWFENTVFVIMADHCASSAGRNELNVKNYHIPAMFFNMKDLHPKSVDVMGSQIDVFPSLFALLNWSYESKMYGRNILKIPRKRGRAFIGTYQKLGLLKEDFRLGVLGPKKTKRSYHWDSKKNLLIPVEDPYIIDQAIAYYQSAYMLYKNDRLKYESAPGEKIND